MRSRWLLAAAAAFCLAQSCASVPPPKPPPPDPAEETIAALTQGLKLDAAQQKRTRELLKEMTDRDDAVHAGWLNGKKVKPEEIQASHSRFEQEFFMLLSTEQKLVFINNKTRPRARSH